MKQKTVRFYENQKDNEALKKLNNYEEYGFCNEREMIIASILEYREGGRYPPSETNIDIDEIVGKIIKGIKENFTIEGKQIHDCENKEDVNENENSEKEIFDKALQFLESL